MQYYQKEASITLREYGRSIQEMINQCLLIEDKTKRTKVAFYIVEMMSKIKPEIKKVTNYNQKLWDHLFFISDFKLDVDAPYEMVEREFIVPKPNKFDYPSKISKNKHYGRYIVDFINEVKTSDEKHKEYYIHQIASYMKQVHKAWNNEVVNDEIVKNDLLKISNGALELSQNESIKQLVKSIPNNKYKNNNHKHKQQKPNNRNNRFKNNNIR